VTQARKHRGYATQRIAAEWFASHGWEFAEPTGAGRAGTDITGMPGLDVEVKARARFDPSAAIRQLAMRSKETTLLGFVLLRLNGQGPACVGDWPVMLRLDDFTNLLRDAGFGDPREK
jgi:hypothetical protein